MDENKSETVRHFTAQPFENRRDIVNAIQRVASKLDWICFWLFILAVQNCGASLTVDMIGGILERKP